MSDAGPVVSVLVSIKGQRSKKARINKEDLDNLLWGGCTSRWFLGCRGDNVLVHTPDERIVPVCALIMKTPKGKRVVLKNGDPLNLTRDNLILVEANAAHG